MPLQMEAANSFFRLAVHIHKEQFSAAALHELRVSAGNSIVGDDSRDFTKRANGLADRAAKLSTIHQQYELARSGDQPALGLQQDQVCLHQSARAHTCSTNEHFRCEIVAPT